MNWYRKLNSMANKLPYNLDKVLHICGGFGITALLTAFGLNKHYSLLTVSVVAVCKESTDKNFSWPDAITWLGGWLLWVVVFL